jgi:hypothetical protein
MMKRGCFICGAAITRKWLRGAIRDAGLAEEVERVEKDESLSPADSRLRIARAIAERYTAPT